MILICHAMTLAFAGQSADFWRPSQASKSGAAIAYASLGTLLEPHRLFTQIAVKIYATDAYTEVGEKIGSGSFCNDLHDGDATRLEGQSNHAATLGLWTLFEHS